MAVQLLHGLGIAACALAMVRAVLWAVASLQAGSTLRKRFTLDQLQLRVQVLAARSKREAAEAHPVPWRGWRKLRIQWIKQELDDCVSLYLANPDGSPLPAFEPGQHITLNVPLPGEAKALVRCYSLSDRHRPDYYRITVKRVGKASTWLTDSAKAGAFLDVKAPSGSFTMSLDETRPAVLLGAGIGITPLFAMASAAAGHPAKREILFFYGMRNSREHLFRRELDMLRMQHPRLKLYTFHSSPLASEAPGRDFSKVGRITPEDVLKQLTPGLKQLTPGEHDFYICGPASFMRTMVEGLRASHIPETSLHYESFGPSSISPTVSTSAPGRRIPVRFEKSSITAEWTPEKGNLLELAEAVGIHLPSGCRTGACETCAIPVKKGRLQTSVHTDVPSGMCLPCVSVPLESVVLDV